MNNITPAVTHHKTIIDKYRKLRRRLKLGLWLVALIYVPLGVMLAGHSIYTGATQLLAKETIYVSEEKAQADRLEAYTEEFMRELAADYDARLKREARQKAIEKLEKELDEEKDKLKREDVSL